MRLVAKKIPPPQKKKQRETRTVDRKNWGKKVEWEPRMSQALEVPANKIESMIEIIWTDFNVAEVN